MNIIGILRLVVSIVELDRFSLFFFSCFFFFFFEYNSQKYVREFVEDFSSCLFVNVKFKDRKIGVTQMSLLICLQLLHFPFFTW